MTEWFASEYWPGPYEDDEVPVYTTYFDGGMTTWWGGSGGGSDAKIINSGDSITFTGTGTVLSD